MRVTNFLAAGFLMMALPGQALAAPAHSLSVQESVRAGAELGDEGFLAEKTPLLGIVAGVVLLAVLVIAAAGGGDDEQPISP